MVLGLRSRSRFLPSVVWLLGLALLPGWNALAAEVWSGPEIVFVRPSKSDPVPTECGDPVSDAVRITRASLQGLFNSVLEPAYGPQSPADTEWAWDLAGFNLGLVISAANFSALEFNAWRSAHGGNPRNALGVPGVVHLISEDVYLDVEFLNWGGSATGGAFAYRRTTPGGPRVCGDMDLDSEVDADDIFRLRTHLAAPEGFDGFGLGPAADSCPVIGVESGCDALDLAVMLRSTAQPALGPGIASVCPAVN